MPDPFESLPFPPRDQRPVCPRCQSTNVEALVLRHRGWPAPREEPVPGDWWPRALLP